MVNAALYSRQDRRLPGFRRRFTSLFNGFSELLLPPPRGSLAFHNPRGEGNVKDAAQPPFVAVVLVSGGNKRDFGAPRDARKSECAHDERPDSIAADSLRIRRIPYDSHMWRRASVADLIYPPREKNSHEEDAAAQ